MSMGFKPQHLPRYMVFAALLAGLFVFLIWPIFITVSGGFLETVPNADGTGTTQQLTFRFIYDFTGNESPDDAAIGVLQDPIYLAGLRNSLMVAVCTTFLCLVLALPMSLLAARFTFPCKAALTSLIMAPLILPPFVGAIGLRALLGRFGALNALLADIGLIDGDQPGIDFLGGAVGGRFLGVVFMEALHLFPIMYLNLTAAMANLDPALDEAALGMGAGPWSRFLKVTLPLITPGLFAGSTIVFIWSFTELGTPLMFDYYTVTPVQIFWGIQEVQSSPRPYALVVVMLTVALSIYIVGKMLLGGRSYASEGKASMASQMRKLTGAKGWAAAGLFIVVIGAAVLPHVGVVISSFTVDGAWYQTILPNQFTTEHYANALSHSLAMDSIRNSLTYASLALVVAVVAGIAISYLHVRVRIPGGGLLDSLAMLPLAVPGLVMAFGYVGMTLRWPFNIEAIQPFFSVVGSNPNPVPLLVIAYGVRRLPYVVRSVSAGLEQTSGSLEEAAFNLGASTSMTLRRIVMPLIMANIIAGAILAFSFAMLEVSDSLILAQKEEHFPITKAIFDFFSRLGDGPYIASAMGVWGMALLTITLVGASLLMGKKLGAIFRV